MNRLLLMLAAIVAAVGLPAAALAGGQPWSSGSVTRHPALGSPLRPNLPPPLLQAAPWYLYWPYEAHFQTAAPIHAPFYSPMMYGSLAPAYPYYPNYVPNPYAAGQAPASGPVPPAGGYAQPSAPPGMVPGTPVSQPR